MIQTNSIFEKINFNGGNLSNDSGSILLSQFLEKMNLKKNPYFRMDWVFTAFVWISFYSTNSPTTGKYWLIKTFKVLKGIQDDVVLDGTVYLDETYFTKVKSKLVTKDEKKR